MNLGGSNALSSLLGNLYDIGTVASMVSDQTTDVELVWSWTMNQTRMDVEIFKKKRAETADDARISWL